MPNELMAEYYGQRTDAGLIITEGTSPSPDGLGYARIPGLFNQEQASAWKVITDTVHAKGGKIFIQLMHTGRVGHQLNIPDGGKVIAPSAIAAKGQMWTDTQGMQEQPVPNEIPGEGIAEVIAAYVKSAELAIAAGFDGVELHAANGYLPMQFLSPGSNRRTDKYGGSHENRNRFVLEVVDAIAAAIGKDKLGIRLSPFNKFNDITPDEQEAAQYMALTEGLRNAGIAYIHLLTFAMPQELVQEMHLAFGGTLILNAGYTAERAEADLAAGRGELVSFGNMYISNPDLAQRMKLGAELAAPHQATFYTPGAAGYTDYPALS
jgi:N-ethylmaleimide reductase